MLSKIHSVELSGLDGQLIEIEVDTRMSLPGFTIVGLPDSAVLEAKERVISAVKNCNIPLPRGKIVVNLAPADIKKVGARYDLAIALGVTVYSEQIKESSFKDTVFLGELALNGKLRPIPGILASTEFAKRKGFKRIFVPRENASEAAIIKGIEVVPVGHIKEAIMYLNGKLSILPIREKEIEQDQNNIVDMCMIRGQDQAKRALEIAAAGGHNILLNGTPGAGKTLMAKALRGILPDMTQEEMLEVTKIHSIAGLLPQSQSLIQNRPFRMVHHTASAVSIVGGGNIPGPGEITLAHRGILFLDEVAEFPMEVLDVLRQPMEDRNITISRAKATITYPAEFTMIAAMNPCPCGYSKSATSKKKCDCPAWKVRRYHQRLSGPFLDRIDIHINIEPVHYNDLISPNEGAETSTLVRARVNKAYRRQVKRFKDSNVKRNAEMNSLMIDKFSLLDDDAKYLLDSVTCVNSLSARGFYKAIKIARTIADLDDSKWIRQKHMSEALQYLNF